MDVLYPDLPLEGEKAEAILRGTDPNTNADAAAAVDVVEAEMLREEQEQGHHQLEVRGTQRGMKGGIQDANNSDNHDSSTHRDGGEDDDSFDEVEEERVAGDYGEEDDLWTDREVKMLLASFYSSHLGPCLQLRRLIILTLIFHCIVYLAYF